MLADLGGEEALSRIERELVEAFASAAVSVRNVAALLLSGRDIDIGAQAQAISSMVRISSRLGTTRRPRDVTPSVEQYLRETEGGQQ